MFQQRHIETEKRPGIGARELGNPQLYLAEMQHRQGKLADAKATIERAIETFPDGYLPELAGAHHDPSEVLSEMGDAAMAAQCRDTAVELQREWAKVVAECQRVPDGRKETQQAHAPEGGGSPNVQLKAARPQPGDTWCHAATGFPLIGIRRQAMTEPKYSADDIQVINLAQGICRRPRMYTPSGSLGEVIAWMYGHMSAAWGRQHSVDPYIEKTVEWLSEQCDHPTDLLADLLSKHTTEENALAAIEQFAAGLNEGRNEP